MERRVRFLPRYMSLPWSLEGLVPRCYKPAAPDGAKFLLELFPFLNALISGESDMNFDSTSRAAVWQEAKTA